MRWVLLASLALISLGSQAAAEPPQNFLLREPPVAVPGLQFTDADGHARSITDFSGKVVLLNVWATWCVPCRKEMPTLDRLQAELGGPDFEVIVLSIDRGGAEVVKKFYAEIGIRHLAIHIDTTSRVGFALAAAGLPTTVLIDRHGKELGRLIGPADWDAPEMVGFLNSIIAQKQGWLVVPPEKEQGS
jgi:thiol-disulfide isomerase/thioredoxin